MQGLAGKRMIHVKSYRTGIEFNDCGDDSFAVFHLQCKLLIENRFEFVSEIFALSCDDTLF